MQTPVSSNLDNFLEERIMSSPTACGAQKHSYAYLDEGLYGACQVLIRIYRLALY